MKSKSKKYSITNTDVESVIRFLDIADPTHADQETAIALLEELQEGFREMQESNPEKLMELYMQLKNEKKQIN